MPVGIDAYVCSGLAVIGTGVIRSYNVASVAKVSTGVYTVTLIAPVTIQTDGVVLANISGPFLVDGNFTDSTHITVRILNLSGVAADPPNGTIIKLNAWQ